MIGSDVYERSTSWTWIAAIWCAGALFDASQNVLIMHTEGHPGPWLPLFVIEFVSWLPWALATPFVISLARRYPIMRGMIIKSAPVHLAAFALISVIAEGWSTMFQVIFDPWHHKRPPTFVDTWSTMLLYQVLTFVIAYALILTITLVIDSREKMARQMTETARLNEELSKSQLAALRRQMEPHFMYNTLNAIAGLVRDQRNDAAVSMIVGLSEFLRRASEDSHRTQVTLEEEVEYLQRYLDIQKVRLGERLRVSLEIPGELLAEPVPGLLLQPLVENAIKHGISRRLAGGLIRVSGVRQDGMLQLTVYNDGPGEQNDVEATRTGIGIGNLRTRLNILYGGRADLILKRADAGGVEVVVKLPLAEV